MLSFTNQQKILGEILKRLSNSNCADCNAISPTWASLDFGVFICPNCSGAHRSLGPTITRVKSTKLDSWHSDWVNNMQIGNKDLNNYWEAKLTAKQIRILQRKPNWESSLDELKKYVVDKYVRRKYVGSGEDPLTIHKNGSVKKTKQEIPPKKEQKSDQEHPKSVTSNKHKTEVKKQLIKQSDLFSFQESPPLPSSQKNIPLEVEDQEFGNYTEQTPANQPQTTVSTTDAVTFNDLLSINQLQNRRMQSPNTMFTGGYHPTHNNYNHYAPLHSHNHMGYLPTMQHLHKSQSQSHSLGNHLNQNMYPYPQNQYHQNYQQLNMPPNLIKEQSTRSNFQPW